MFYFLVLLSTLVVATPFPLDLDGLAEIDTLKDRPLDSYSSTSLPNPSVADENPPNLLSIGCSSDASFTSDVDHENIQKRVPEHANICPSQYDIPKTPSPQASPQIGPEVGQYPSTTTGYNPCSRQKDKPDHVTCGGPEVLVDRIDDLMVINCVRGKQSNVLLPQYNQTLSQRLMV